MNVDIGVTDRTAGVILGAATGDALGAGYEFGLPLGADDEVEMRGGGPFNWAPGEWTDDTSMMFPILEAGVAGRDLTDESVLDAIVAGWVDWAKTAPDVGNQLRAVLSGAEPRASSARSMARLHHERFGHSAGNGSLMRTAPVALAYLHDRDGLIDAARVISDLTHYESDAGDACVLWSLAIRHAILHDELDVRSGLDALPVERRQLWADRLDEAEVHEPSHFSRNGWVVQALQGAWSAIWHTGDSDPELRHDRTHLRRGIEAAVRGGRDTDTVAAIAGALLGARYGVGAVPTEWRLLLHGWPGATGEDLERLAVQTALGRDTVPFT
ncbi:ADP-ribosylglycohydrolase family protein [Homoserinimonas sp. OAct 916]|uniref:ADP-ribosylglycohydrolase family protein n=1 Tax=Homoserinimonas sp. OAct 916 TaxID=2211450 RepID=UPI000DBE2ED2|nr:ADP-ribosylglycohydrolase family protein [Homoserinimonas sp. OAct 916]